MAVNPTLYCPIRGQLTIKAKTADGLKFTEEKRRIDCIKFLLKKNYPRTHIQIESTILKLGHKGKNSFRADLVVFDIPATEANLLKIGDRRNHIELLAEIKRENDDAENAKETQVRAALWSLPNMDAIGIYWDDLEQTVIHREIKGTKQHTIEAGISYLPDYGGKLELKNLTYSDLVVSPSLVGLFRRIEDIIHPQCADKSLRYQMLLQLLLAKIHDEESHKTSNGEMSIQDFTVFTFNDSHVEKSFNRVLRDSVDIYEKYLPKEIPDKFTLKGSTLRQISRILSAVNLLASGPEVIQEFYMYFAKELYKWDLAQYFTPYEVVDFIVRIVNPRYGNTIKDPACGSADFLVSAHRRGMIHDPKIGQKIWGADNSSSAVQISVLNMVLNGDGKSNIREEDSLAQVDQDENQYTIMLCNPPFGVKIVETRKEVLAKFDLGQQAESDDPEDEDDANHDDDVQTVGVQETGILFAELCVKQAKPGGRIAIILPNGYLGNRSERYRRLREWMLCHTKIAAIIGFPRFTFKKSGADVSASVIVMEKRKRPLSHPKDSESYPIYVNLLESVGWEIGNKKAKKILKKNALNGAVLLDKNNDPILDADFEDVLADLYASPVADAFSWIAEGVEGAGAANGWAISNKDISQESDFILDPKRYCKKYRQLVDRLASQPHVRLLEICDLVPPAAFGKDKSKIYRYVQLDDVHKSSVEFTEMRGWALPDRAKHLAEQGDIFIASIWSSIEKWFIAGAEANDKNMVVTNGCHRLKIKEGKEEFLPDLVFSLASEAYRVQMRAVATGSDGLAQISEIDLKNVIIPLLQDQQLRDQVARYIHQFRDEPMSLYTLAEKRLGNVLKGAELKPRRWNFSQV